MPNGDPRDRIFYPTLTLMIDSYIINAHAYIFSEARGLDFGLSLHLLPCFIYVSSKGFDESALMKKVSR